MSRAISPITLIVLTRLLEPAEYGAYAGALTVVLLFQMMVESGVARALVQMKGDVQELASPAFTLSVLIGVVLALVLWALSDVLAYALAGAKSTGGVIAAMGFQIPVAAAGAIYRALLERELRFRAIFVGRLVGVAATAVVSIALAIADAGVWALVGGALAGISSEVFVLRLISGFRPRLGISRAPLAAVANFSAWTLGHDLLAWVTLYADTLLVAAFLNSEELGRYRVGSLLVASGFAALFVPAERVLFSAFSKLPDVPTVAKTLYPLLVSGALLALPMGLALFVGHAQVEAIVFPDRWSGVGLVIGLVGLLHAISNSVFAVDPAYKGVGRPDLIFKIRLINVAVLMTLQVIAIQIGFEAFLVARLVGVLVAAIVILVSVRWFFGRCEIVWNRSHYVAAALLFAILALTLASERFPSWSAGFLVAFFLALVPYSIVVWRILRSIITRAT